MVIKSGLLTFLKAVTISAYKKGTGSKINIEGKYYEPRRGSKAGCEGFG